MMWYLVLVFSGLSAEGTFQVSAPIRWLQFPTRHITVEPRGVPATGLDERKVHPQLLTISDQSSGHSLEEIPHFTMKDDHTITWSSSGWCVEADGRKSGDVARINICNGMPSQRWNWVADSHGRHLINLQHTNLCLDVVEKGRWQGAAIELQECGEVAASWMFAARTPVSPPSQHHARHMLICLVALAGVAISSLSFWLWQRQAKPYAATMRSSILPLAADEGGVSQVSSGVALTGCAASLVMGEHSVLRNPRWVRQTITREGGMHSDINQWHTAISEAEQNRSQPTVELLANHMEVSKDTVRKIEFAERVRTVCMSTTPEDMECVTLELRIPANRLECAAWISKQPPAAVADALSLCELGVNAVRQQLSEGETARLMGESAELRRRLETVEAQAADAVAEAVHKTREDLEIRHAKTQAQQQKAHAEDLARVEGELASRKQKHAETIAALHMERQQVEEEAAHKRTKLHHELARLHTEELEQMRREHEKKVERVKESQADEIRALAENKKQLSDELALARSLDKAERAEAIESVRLNYETKLDQLQKEHLTRLSDMEKQQQRREEQEKEQMTWFRGELDGAKQQLTKVFAEKEQLALQSKEEMRSLLEEQKTFLGGLRGSSAGVGQIGENFVAQIFASMNLGSWTDTRGEASAGDALWEWIGNEGGSLRCMTEIKNVKVVNTVKDLQRFWSDIDVNTRAGKINAGLLISLSARIPDTRPLDLKMRNGIPVLQASRSAGDALPAAQLVELAFSAFASVWLTIARSRGDDVDSVLDSIARQLDTQMEELESMSKRINAIERSAITIQRQAVGIRKIRDAMVGSIDNLRLQYPELTTQEQEQEGAQQPVEEAWESEPGKALLAAIESFKIAKNGRYPKHLGELPVTEDVLEFASGIPNSFEKAKSMVKKAKTRKRARTEE